MVSIEQRMHSGEHIFVQSLIRQESSVKVEKVELGEKESKVFVWADKLNWDTIFKAEKLTNDIINEGREITIKEFPKSEAANLDIRIRLDRIKSDTVRVVEVNDFDISACAGEHCTNSSEIKGFFVNWFKSLGNNRYEIRFMVDKECALFEHSRILRKILTLLNTDEKGVFDSVRKLKDNNKQLTEQIREFQKEQPLKINEEKVGSVNFVSGDFDNFEKYILMKKINEYVDNKTVVCFLNTAEKGTYVTISLSSDSGFNANELLQKILKEFEGKGGGKDNFASGFVAVEYREKIIPKLKEFLS